jgi:hypothetical protein
MNTFVVLGLCLFAHSSEIEILINNTKLWQPQGVGSVVGQLGTLSMLLKVLGSKFIECKLLLGAIGLGFVP